MRGDDDSELFLLRGVYEQLAALRGRTKGGASFGRSLDVAPAMGWPGEAVIDARDEFGGRDWSIAFEPNPTSAQLVADVTFPVAAIIEAGAEGVGSRYEQVHLNFAPDRNSLMYLTPRGQVIHVSGEKCRVSLAQQALGGGQGTQTWPVFVTATQGRPQRSYTSTDTINLANGASVRLRPPKFSTAMLPVTPPIGWTVVQNDELAANPVVGAFATSVPGQRIPLARRAVMCEFFNASGATGSFSVQWEIVA